MYKYELIIVWSDEDGRYVVEVPELPGCMSDGESYEEAIRNAQIAVSEWIETAQRAEASGEKYRNLEADSSMHDMVKPFVLSRTDGATQ
jgi:predicted RNase H-like HicB family nuclease